MMPLTRNELSFMQAAIEAGLPNWFEETISLTGDKDKATLEYAVEYVPRNRIIFQYKDYSYLELLQAIVDSVRKFRQKFLAEP